MYINYNADLVIKNIILIQMTSIKPRVLIIGAGWYGSTIGCLLQEESIDFDIIDKSDSFFSGSSSKNQNRLHQSFHYSRSHSTRVECRRGYDKFMSRYPDFSESLDTFYVVFRKSILDFKTFTGIFEHEDCEFKLHTLCELRKRGIDLNESFVDSSNVILTNERWINFEKAKKFFTSQLSYNMKRYDPKTLHISEDGERIYYDNVQYSHAFDCTYGQLFPMNNSVFEACVTLIYLRKDDYDKMSPSITVVDGQFYSLYPYMRDKSLYTLTHVKYTPMFESENLQEVQTYIQNIGKHQIDQRRDIIEQDVSESFVNFLNTHEYHSYFISTKTKFTDAGSADRSVRIVRNGNVISSCGGKITGAFDTEDVVREIVREIKSN